MADTGAKAGRYERQVTALSMNQSACGKGVIRVDADS